MEPVLPRKIFSKLKKKESLTVDEMNAAMELIVAGVVPDDEIEQFLLYLREKGESVTEIACAARVMRKYALKLTREFSGLLDTCGTGGDAKGSLNVSTLAALTASAAGIRVAKHGNRSVSSQCGSADILEALGIRIDLEIPAIEESLDKHNFAFFFAPTFHPATRYAMPARKKIQGKTLFNILGPLANPAGAHRQLVGVYDEKLVLIVANVLANLGSERALVVHSLDGLDEISLSADTAAAELKEGKVTRMTLSPAGLGLKKCALKEFQCATKDAAVTAARRVLKGARGPQTDLVALNAGAALYVSGQAKDIREGYQKASALIEGGSVAKKVDELVSFSLSKAAA